MQRQNATLGAPQKVAPAKVAPQPPQAGSAPSSTLVSGVGAAAAVADEAGSRRDREEAVAQISISELAAMKQLIEEANRSKVRRGEVDEAQAEAWGYKDEWRADVEKRYVFNIPTMHKFEKLDEDGFLLGKCFYSNMTPAELFEVGGMHALQHCDHEEARADWEKRKKWADDQKKKRK
jgi:hypothetical protein